MTVKVGDKVEVLAVKEPEHFFNAGEVVTVKQLMEWGRVSAEDKKGMAQILQSNEYKLLTPMEIVNDWHEKLTTVKSVSNPFKEQVGGSHYKSMKIQPVEFILANGLGFCEGNIIKYTCRYKQKGGVEDLKKVVHYAQLLIKELETK